MVWHGVTKILHALAQRACGLFTLRESRRGPWRFGGLERFGKAWTDLEAWRTGAKGSLGWKMGAWGLENWSLGVQNDAWDLQIGAKMGPGRPKSGLGGSRDVQNWILDGLEGGLEGSGLVWTAILGVQGTVWTPSWGHLGAPGGVSGSILEGFGGPKRVQKSNFLDPGWKSVK